MRLPSGPDDGALPLAQVLQVLRTSGVTVLQVDNRSYLSTTDLLEVQLFTDPVRRDMINRLSRRFNIHILRFYYPEVDDPERH